MVRAATHSSWKAETVDDGNGEVLVTGFEDHDPWRGEL